MSDSRFAWLLTAAYVLLTVPRLLLHELWRDEAWLWLVVTESDSIADLRVPLARSGQGSLFPLLCFLARQISTSILALQIVNLVISAAGAYVFARWAPFGRPQRALLVFGYFLFYEYAVISRHYALGTLLVGLACVAVSGRRVLLGAVFLALLCQTTVYGLLIAAAIACGWVFDRVLRRQPVPAKEAAAGAAIVLAGVVAGIVQLRPLPGTSFSPGWRFAWDASHAAAVVQTPWRALVPLPRFQLHFWNTNLLDAWPAVEIIAGIVILAWTILFLRRSNIALLTYAIGAAGLLAFAYVKYAGTLRHHGHWWLLFVAALWLGGVRPRSRVFLGILLLQCVAAAYASWMDLRHPFSNGSEVAKLIREQQLDRYPLFGHREPPSATVALYLGRPLFAPSRGIFTTHPDWGPEQRELSVEEVRCAARALAQRERKPIVLVMNWRLPPWEEVTPLASTSGAIVSTEEFHVYRMRPARLCVAAAHNAR